jgi:hypothetical protein
MTDACGYYIITILKVVEERRNGKENNSKNIPCNKKQVGGSSGGLH